ncbi:MAG: histidinol-phosphate transaminase [Xanthomonadales bacterium PRO6]|nr:Histidinol-phosphate aminotransferase [Xanthomonadales bacterium]MCE7930541.1 histidinol-phosphate transaminase [Xanthomonadales bacterium PRO6]
MQIEQLAAPGVQRLTAYDPGYDPETIRLQLGLPRMLELGSNENGHGPSASVLELLRGRDFADAIRYPDAGGRKLRSAIGARWAVDPRAITLGNGSHELLVLIAETFVAPGDEVVFPQYGFAVFKLAAIGSGGLPVQVSALPRSGAQPLGADPEAMAQALSSRTRLVYLANPNNPTGTWWDRATLARFLVRVPHHAVVVIDEAYREYVDERLVPDAVALQDLHPHVVVTRTFSKAHGLAALRIGYAISNPALASVLERTRLTFNANLYAQRAATAAIADRAHVERVRAANAAEREKLAAGLKSLGLFVFPSQGNFVLADFGRPAKPVEDALLRRGAIVRPMGGYGLPNCLRITVGLPEENREFLELLETVLREDLA